MERMHYIILGALALSGLLTACGPAGVEQITVKGSDTEVNLALSLAEDFMGRDSLVSISVTGGGSGSGIAALINRKTDIANSSRDMTEAERAMARARGVQPVGIIFAIDALAVIVHPDNPVESLTTEQIGAIYRGDVRNWKEVGGADQPISLYGRQSNSGTFVFFREQLLKGEYSRDMKQMNGTAQLVEGVKNDRAGIGYVGIVYVVNPEGEADPGLKVLAIGTGDGTPAVSPLNVAAITSGAYTITRPLFQFTDSIPTGRLLDFIEFELSEPGQQIVRASGYFPVSDTYRRQNEKLGIYAERQVSR